MSAFKMTKIARLAAGTCLLAAGATSALAVPPEQYPFEANYVQALYGCVKQCESHVPPGIPPQQVSVYCPQRCRGMLSYEPTVVAPPGTTGGGGLDCLLNSIGNWGFYGACQAIWTVTTSGLGQVSNLVAALLGGNTQLAQQLVNTAKGVADPCGYLKSQLDAQLARQCQ
jgi:hypothetical protein